VSVEFGWDPYLPKEPAPESAHWWLPVGLDREGGSHDFEKNDFGPMFEQACARLLGTPITYKGGFRWTRAG